MVDFRLYLPEVGRKAVMKEKMDEKLINQSTCTCMYPDSTLLLGEKTNGVSSTVGELVTVYNNYCIYTCRQMYMYSKCDSIDSI